MQTTQDDPRVRARSRTESEDEMLAFITLPGTLPLYCLVASLLVMPDVIVEKLNSWRGCNRKEKKLNVKDTIKKHI